MAKTQKQQEAANRYLKEKVDIVNLRIAKGQKSIIKVEADKVGQSLNAYIAQAISERMERDKVAKSNGSAKVE